MRFADSSFVSNPGSPIKVKFAPKVSDKGSVELMEVGIENFQEYIDSFRDSSEIGNVIARFQNTGDAGILQQRVGQYGDFTDAPKTLAQALQLQIDSNLLFDSLPTDIKQKFDNDRNQFFAMSGTQEWLEKMDSVLPESMRLPKPDAELNPVQPIKEVTE